MPCLQTVVLLAALSLPAAVQDLSRAQVQDLLKDYLEVPNPIINERAATRIRALGAKLVPFLEEELRAEDVGRRRRGAAGAALIGTAATPLMELLALQLGDPDPRLAGNAAAALGQIGAAARPAVPALVELAASKDPELRRLSLVARARIVEQPQALISECMALTADPAVEPRRAAALLLLRYAGDGPELFRALLPLTRDRDAVLAREATEGLAARGVPARDWCFEVAREGEPLDKARALMLLGHFRPLEDRHVTLLLDELEDREFNQAARQGLMATETLARDELRARFRAALTRGADDELLRRFLFCFVGLGDAAAGFDGDMLPLLSRAGSLRIQALRTLVAIGVTDPGVGAALITLAREAGGEDAQLAVDALGHVAEAGPAVMDALFALLEGDAALRRAAGYALGRLGPATLASADRLLGLAAADDVAGQWARVAVGELGEAILPAVVRRIEAETDPQRRARLVSGLGEMGETKAPVVVLRRWLSEGEVQVRVAAALALGRLGEYGREAVPALREASGAEEERVRLAAVTALGMLGRGDRRLVEPLAARVVDEDGAVARAAVDAIGRLALPETVDTFLPLLEHEDAGIRWRAAYWLGTLGASARRAVPGLMALLEDPDPIVRKSAARAAELIRKGGR